ncbi:uncharacterized protein [Gossypium hirsutum]|uniref:Retrovirus-related Pol polyprotein from transposon TNT 1-94 n=1 Tax=Gossypium hirsutum TaxID=3635 RepID=A0A1U8KTA6_GOSHI|nr:uncharacterized protein LOC107919239 [Gossypium hirsutum]
MAKSSSNNSAFVQPAVPKFDGYYEHWAKLMENFLRVKEFWSLVEDRIDEIPVEIEPSEEEVKLFEEQQMKDKKKFKGSTRVKRAQLQALKIEFKILRMKEGETVNAYFGRTLSIAKKMKAYRENIKEADITLKILQSLVPKFNYVLCSIEESNNMKTLSVDELQSSLLIYEQRMIGPIEEEYVLKVTNEDRGGRDRG